MAIRLVGLVKHTLDSVFSWTSENLDKFVVLGDKLNTSLRDNMLISCQSKLLCSRSDHTVCY